MKNQKNANPGGLSQKLWVVIGLLIFLAAVAIIATINRNKEVGLDNRQPQQTQTTGLAPGTNQVEGNQVVDQEGSTVRNDVKPMSSVVTRQSEKVVKENLPTTVIKLDIGNFTWSPTEFTVKAGETVSIAVTSTDNITYVFAFDDPLLGSIKVGVSPGETRTITFDAPTKTGEYTFKSDMRGHASRGAVGKMIVK